MKNFLLSVFLLLVTGTTAWAQGEKMGEAKLEKATFAGGCFWCMQGPFEEIPGVKGVVVGYTGGTKVNPTYEEVSSGTTGHCEAIEVTYDPTQVSYEKLLDIFWHNIDPTTPDQQFADEGTQYRTGIFYHSEEQKRLAEKSKKDFETAGKFSAPIVTEITPASTFYRAEEYHQDFFKKNPFRYNAYRAGSGRDQYLKKTWGKDQSH